MRWRAICAMPRLLYDHFLHSRFSLLILTLFVAPAAEIQDPGAQLNDWIGEKTGKRLQLQFELRQRVEDRTGQLFGRDRDLAADYIRSRFGMIYKPAPWIKFAALAQDTRAPLYGLPPPGNVKDPLDLQEGYVEIFSPSKRGLGLNVGRQMINYGDTRLIGSPQWAYTARTWDTLRLYHVSSKARLEGVFLSTIVPRADGFNKPVLGDRIWGMYSSFGNVSGAKPAKGASLWASTVVDAYVLRHDQNRPGGFTGIGTLGINLFGSRWAFTLPHNLRYTAEGIVQTGHVGLLPHRAAGFANQFGYKTMIGKLPVDFANEYKYASGTQAGSGRSGTFDQLYPAAHDKMGHVDLFGWKNVHNVRSVATVTVRKGWNWILMYNNSWLANQTDGVYTTGSRLIARDITGRAGRHIGQELDLYTNYVLRGMSIGAGVGQFFAGEFVKRTTPGVNSRLIYLSTGYSF